MPDNEQVHEVAGSMEISDETGVDDDVDDIPGGVRAVFVGGAYSWFVEDDIFELPDRWSGDWPKASPRPPRVYLRASSPAHATIGR
jgi:hypothetical protein